MNQIKKLIGMGWTTPIARTFLQAALPVLVAAGVGWVDADVWKTAFLAGGAAVIAFGQAEARK